MDLDQLLALSPEELAGGILARRKGLAELLPLIETRNSDEADKLDPEVEKLRLARDLGSNKVADLKLRRNAAQAEAHTLLAKVRALRETMEAAGGLTNLDPKWAKEKLEESLAALEIKIDEQALSLKDERRLLAERKAILAKNDEFLEKRRQDNPEMTKYIEASRKMQKLFRQADKLHAEMLTRVEKNEPKHAEFIEKREGLKSAMRQVDRSRALIRQSDSAIAYWESTLKDGFDSLLGPAKKVVDGGASSVRRRNAELPAAPTTTSGGEEE
jgi:uncharacterized coiled-coil DUF342 family protein